MRLSNEVGKQHRATVVLVAIMAFGVNGIREICELTFGRFFVIVAASEKGGRSIGVRSSAG